MMKSTLSSLFITVLFYKHVSSYFRVCYYTNWAQYRPSGAKFTPENIDPTLCSHIIYAFGKLQGNLLVPMEWNDESTQWSQGMYDKVNSLKQTNPQLRSLLAVGGWNAGSPPFSTMARSEASRRTFINSTLHYLREKNFDGLDIDWEYPARRGGRPDDKANLVHLLSELRQVFEQESYHTGLPRLLLSAAVPAGKSNIDAGYDIPNVARNLDFINIMTYDLHGSWDSITGHNSPLHARADESLTDATLNMEWAVNYWLKNGAPKHKLVVGLGLYGRSFKLEAATSNGMGSAVVGAGKAGKYTKEPGFLAYYEVCEELNTGATRVWQAEHKAPYAYKGDLWVGYDDVQSIREKVRWMKKNKFGGVMIWSLALDDFNGQFCNQGKYPLLTAVNEELGVKKPTTLQGLPSIHMDSPVLDTNLLQTPLSLPPSLPDLHNQSPDGMLSAALPFGRLDLPPSQPPMLSELIPNNTPVKPPPPPPPPPIIFGNTGNTNTQILPDITLPIILSDPGQRAAVSNQPVPPVRHDRSHNSETMLIAQNTQPDGLLQQMNPMSMSLAHDRPPDIVPIDPSMVAPNPAHLIHHAQPVPDLVLPTDTQSVGSLTPVLVPDAPHAAAVHAGIMPVAAPVAPVVPMPVGGPVEFSIDQPSSSIDLNAMGNPTLVSSGIPNTALLDQLQSIGTVAGIPLSAVRPAPASKPGVNISIKSSSNSSSSSSSSKSNSQSSTINIGSQNPLVANTLRELLQHHNPLSSSSSSSSSSAASSGGGHDHGGGQMRHTGHDNHPISVSVVERPQDLNIPPGSRVEAVIPINSIDNLAEVLSSLGTSVSSPSVLAPDANALNAGQVMRELDLANLLGIDANTLGGAIVPERTASPSFTPAVPREIPRSRQVFRSPTIDQQPIARRTSSNNIDNTQQLLRQLQGLQGTGQRSRTVVRSGPDRRQSLANLRARRLALLRARQRAAALHRQQQQQQQQQQQLQQRQQQQQQSRVDLNQLSATQLRRLLNRLDGATLQRLISNGRLTLTPNVEQPRPVTLSSTQGRAATVGGRPAQVTRLTRPRTLRVPTSRVSNNRFTGTVIRPQGARGRRVAFINNNAPGSNRITSRVG